MNADKSKKKSVLSGTKDGSVPAKDAKSMTHYVSIYTSEGRTTVTSLPLPQRSVQPTPGPFRVHSENEYGMTLTSVPFESMAEAQERVRKHFRTCWVSQDINWTYND